MIRENRAVLRGLTFKVLERSSTLSSQYCIPRTSIVGLNGVGLHHRDQSLPAAIHFHCGRHLKQEEAVREEREEASEPMIQPFARDSQCCSARVELLLQPRLAG